MTDRTSAAPIVLIADDHPLFRVALRLAVKAVAPDATIVETDSFESLTTAAAATPPADLVLLDLLMPGAEGLSSLQYLSSQHPALRVAVVSSLSEQVWVRLAQTLGAVAFIHKSISPDEMQTIIRRLLDGESSWVMPAAMDDRAKPRDAAEVRLGRLSPQELRIMLHLRDGRLNKQIASDLGISESTVKTHISTLLRKLDLQTRTQAAVLAQRLMANPERG